jgi:hypothetical protein
MKLTQAQNSELMQREVSQGTKQTQNSPPLFPQIVVAQLKSC